MLNFGLMLMALALLTTLQRDARATQALAALTHGLTCAVSQSCEDTYRR